MSGYMTLTSDQLATLSDLAEAKDRVTFYTLDRLVVVITAVGDDGEPSETIVYPDGRASGDES